MARRQAARPVDTVALRFREPGDARRGASLHADLSAVVATDDGRCLWLASDETSTVERLVADGDGAYGGHRTIPLHALLDLPEGEDGEADIEGLAVDGGYLWIAGSHSLARKKPEPDEHDADAALARLTEVKHQANRFLLGRVPLDGADAGGDGDAGAPRRAARLKMKKGRNALTRALRKDTHFGRFLAVPAKENGFDIEGIAVRGDRVLLGLRGPVLRGWAVVLEIVVEEKRPGRLKLRRLDDAGGGRYRKHFLDLGGLGIRALLRDGDDVLILAGPTMDLDGPVRLYRWRDAWTEGGHAVVKRSRVERVLDLPHGHGCDHAEGAVIQRRADGPALLVLYDSPAEGRLLRDGSGVLADRFRLPAAPPARSRPRPPRPAATRR